LVLALFWQSRRKKRPFFDLSDRFSFSAALGACLIRIGNLFNSEIVGKIAPPDAFFAIAFPLHDRLPAELCPYRYPTQILEAFLGLFVLGALFLADRLLGKERRPMGVLSGLFLSLYFLGRFLAEFLKERQTPSDDLFLSRGQLLSVIPFLLGIAVLAWAAKRKKREAGALAFGGSKRGSGSNKNAGSATAAGAGKAFKKKKASSRRGGKKGKK
jgi:prolipoprotein diacylglyceryl transferase